MPHIVVDGVKLFYEMRGTGPPLYVLHGGPGFDHSYFGDSLAGIERARTLYYLDFRGHGLSDRCPRETYRFSRLAADVEGFRRSLGHDAVDILGHSVGGMIALLHALAHPDSQKKLILATTGPRGFGPLDFLKIKGHNRIKLSLAAWFPYRLLSDLAARLLGRSPDLKDFMLDYYRHAFPLYGFKEEQWPANEAVLAGSIKSDMDVYESLGPELQRFNIVSRLTEIRVPTLTILGGDDVLERFMLCGSELEKIPGSRLVLVPGTSHWVFREKTERFNQEILDFLNE